MKNIVSKFKAQKITLASKCTDEVLPKKITMKKKKKKDRKMSLKSTARVFVLNISYFYLFSMLTSGVKKNFCFLYIVASFKAIN
jgi:hypothetical protein